VSVLLAIALGLLIGLSLGALGGGGSILTVPVLVYAIGQSAQDATTGSLVIVGITSAVAAVGHARSGGSGGARASPSVPPASWPRWPGPGSTRTSLRTCCWSASPSS